MGGQQAAFPSTSQSAISGIRRGEPAERTRALEIVIEAYWKPVYKYIRLKWRASNETAKDLTQGFFAKAIEKDFFQPYDPSKASFRTFLRICLDRFVANENKSAGRSKRTSGSPDLSLDFDGAEGELSLQEIPDRVSMEDYFYQEWVRSLFGLAVESLRYECEANGKTIHFRLFERYDLEGDSSVEKLSYELLAAEFELSTSTVTNYLAYARREFRRIVLDKLRSITDTDEEFRNEARHLLGVQFR
jgi:RNA polymerase sigma factor (sigma-70 family)